ncbi:hypothetical protein QW131_10415 [Roseibium salinum]|nr:hypothetical protein [Roseibium salinum]
MSKRPDFTSILGDFGTLKRLPTIIRALAGGDDSLLTKVIRLFEDEGYRVVGIKDVAPQLLASSGVLGRIRPKEDDWRDLQLALRATEKNSVNWISARRRLPLAGALSHWKAPREPMPCWSAVRS